MSEHRTLKFYERAHALQEWGANRSRWQRRLFILTLPVSLLLYSIFVVCPFTFYGVWAMASDDIEAYWNGGK